MTSGLRPYAEMKDSGIEWLERVPAHWSVVPGRAYFRMKKELNSDLREKTVLSLSFGRIVVKAPETLHGLVPSSFETYQIVAPSDIIVRPTDLQNDQHSLRFGLSTCRGIITSAYLRFNTLERVLPKYGHLLLHTYDLMKVFYGLGSGLRQNLDWSDFKHLPCVLPPVSEQSAVVRFLDEADRRIRRYIQAKEKLIAVLEEHKQVIIHQAVTGQIDTGTGKPYPTYKDSGVEWLDPIPKHWEALQLRRMVISRCDGPFGSGLKSSHYTDEGVRVIRLQNIGHGEFKNADAAYISEEHCATLGNHSVVPRDLLVAGLGDSNHPAGRACVAPRYIAPAIVKADCFRFRLLQARIDPHFLALQMTATARTASAMLSTGATRQRINLETTSGRAIAVPSSVEQRLVVEYVKSSTAHVARAQDAIHGKIEHISEFHTRLVADVVTGKLDVREAAAALPEPDNLNEVADDGRHGTATRNFEESVAALVQSEA